MIGSNGRGLTGAQEPERPHPRRDPQAKTLCSCFKGPPQPAELSPTGQSGPQDTAQPSATMGGTAPHKVREQASSPGLQAFASSSLRVGTVYARGLRGGQREESTLDIPGGRADRQSWMRCSPQTAPP